MDRGIGIFGAVGLIIIFYISQIILLIINGIMKDYWNIPFSINIITLLSNFFIYFVIYKKYNMKLSELTFERINSNFIVYVILGLALFIFMTYLKRPYNFQEFYMNTSAVKENMKNTFASYASKYELIQDIFYVLGIMVLFPVLEEILYRGFLFKGISIRYNIWFAMIVVTAIFAFMHTITDKSWLLGVFISGLIYTLILIQTENIGVSIMCHILNNSMAFVMQLVTQLYPDNHIVRINNDRLLFNPMLTIISGIVFSVISIWLLYSVYRKYIN